LTGIVKSGRVYQNEIDVVISKSVWSYFIGGCDISQAFVSVHAC
jgi:hypothetical protein